MAQSGLVGKNGIDTNAGRAQYQASADSFVLAEGQNEIAVPLTFEKDGVLYTKTFTLKRGSYDIAVDYLIDNKTAETIEVQPYGQLKHTLIESAGNFAMPTYTGGAYSSSEVNYKKYSFEEMAKANLSIDTKAGWAAILQHYFVSAWIPNQDAENNLYTRTANGVGILLLTIKMLLLITLELVLLSLMEIQKAFPILSSIFQAELIVYADGRFGN